MIRLKLYLILLIFSVDIFAALDVCPSHTNNVVAEQAVTNCHSEQSSSKSKSSHVNASFEHSEMNSLEHDCKCDHCTVFTLAEFNSQKVSLIKVNLVSETAPQYRTQPPYPRFRPPILTS